MGIRFGGFNMMECTAMGRGQHGKATDFWLNQYSWSGEDDLNISAQDLFDGFDAVVERCIDFLIVEIKEANDWAERNHVRSAHIRRKVINQWNCLSDFADKGTGFAGFPTPSTYPIEDIMSCISRWDERLLGKWGPKKTDWLTGDGLPNIQAWWDSEGREKYQPIYEERFKMEVLGLEAEA